MKLSILIPVYNYDCRPLVSQLLKQLPNDAEIIVADDCSTDLALQQLNKEIAGWEACNLWIAPTNMGRAAIRNRLADMAQGEVLLFIDCDAQVTNEQFINNYLEAITEHDVVCGGTGNLSKCPSKDVVLRWRYEVKAEQRLTLELRRMQPYAQFTTFNFAIKKEVFNRIRFDENYKQYGHEDTQFGIRLKECGCDVWHINNKLIHLGLEPADEYIDKVETSLRTAVNMTDVEKQSLRIACIATRLEKWHIKGAMQIYHRLFAHLELCQLKSSKPSLCIFNLYKLGYYCCL